MKTIFPRFLLLALLGPASILVAGCKSADDVTTPDYATIDEGIIKQYIADNKITNAQRQPSGLYFVPDSVNATAVPATAGKTVSVLYTGQYMGGTVFDASSLHGNKPISFVLGKGNVIKGWDEGIALMHKGDRARLLIPSALAYGPSGYYTIPPNTVLRFDVKLTDVN